MTGKRILRKPKCDNCGARIYRTRGIPAYINLGKIPKYCQRCGEQISIDKANNLLRQEELLWLLWCAICTIIIIIILVIFI